MSDTPRHMPALDGVRGLAILLVIAFHGGLLPNTGWVGVDLFFVLSGYLITGILVRGTSPGRFYRRRIARILPAYAAYLLVVLVLWPRHSQQPVAAQGWYWGFLTNLRLARALDVPILLQHLWSVAVEEQFYLVWPVLVWTLPRPWLRPLCVAGIAGALLLRVGADTSAARYALAPMRMDALLVGAWLALGPPMRHWRALSTAAGLAALALIAWAGLHSRAVETIGLTLNAVAFGGLLWASLTSAGVADRLSAGWLRTAGRYSYMAYLVHPLPLVWGLRHGVTPGLPLTIATSVVTFLIAWVSWRVLEAPILRLAHRYDARAASASCAITSEPASLVCTPSALK